MNLRAPRIVARGLLLPLLLALSASAPAPAEDGAGGAEAAPPREYVGKRVCAACHIREARHWSETLHARIFEHAPRTVLEARACEACHGPGSLHAASPVTPGSLVAFTRGSETEPAEQNEACLACHGGGRRIAWTGSAHQRADLACSDCHDPMTRTSERGLLRRGNVNETCFTCHPHQRLEFRKRSHMPLLEGRLSCSDCHDPHGSTTSPLIRADSINALCQRCHAEKRGPFIWEHAPVTDSCLNCHTPHGSRHPSLLTARPPALCQQCHLQSSLVGHVSVLLTRDNLAFGARPDERLINRGCPNCHSQIHGSNHPSGARFHR